MSNKMQCACCEYFTVETDFDICPVCYWQKDFYQEKNIDDSGGPNTVSLRDAKKNFKKLGAIEEDFLNNVRPPFEGEKVDKQ